MNGWLGRSRAHGQPDSLKPERSEAEGEEGALCIGPPPRADVVLVHVDRQLGVAVEPVQLLEPGGSDEAIVAELADREQEATRAMRLVPLALQPGGGIPDGDGHR